MIIDFSIKNFGPFKDKVCLSLESTSLDGIEENILEPESSNPLLSSAAIFGANASGKSYVIKAMEVLQNMVKAPMNPNMIYPWYQPFRLSSSTLNAPIELSLRFIKNSVEYDYSISFMRDRVVFESLFYYPLGRKAMVFTRNNQDFQFGRTAIRGLKTSSGMTSPSSSFLAVAAQFNNNVCLVVHQGIVNDIIVVGSSEVNFDKVVDCINRDSRFKNHLMKALRIADFGIVDAIGNTKMKNIADLKKELPPQIVGLMMATGNIEIPQTTLFMKHYFEQCDVEENILNFPYGIESNGTIQMFCLMGPIVDSLEKGYTILIDEFGTYLHSDVAKWILRQFRSCANPNNSQLIINTQDQSLLSLDFLRRDQIWFTQKDMKTGASELYSLSDFKGVRQDVDLQKSYSINKFGGKPFILDEDVIT